MLIRYVCDCLFGLLLNLNSSQLRNTGELSVLDKSGEMTSPVTRELDLQLAGKMHRWISFLLLLTPDEFVDNNIFNLLKTALAQTFVVPVYAEDGFAPHQEYDNLCSNYKTANKVKLYTVKVVSR